VEARRQRLLDARLYLVCDRRPEQFLAGALDGGVDVVQLRIKDGADRDLIDAARTFRRICSEHGALFILNDRPDLVEATGADGVHLGQDDMPVTLARELVGEDRLIGLSTHSQEQVGGAAGADYIGVGPVNETPTKPGRPAVGLELVRYAAGHATVPWFAIGGIGLDNVDAVRGAGAERVAVVRALTEARDPEGAARILRSSIARAQEVGVGPA
jgi:thiamine-phosphate pyrophosphorylase